MAFCGHEVGLKPALALPKNNAKRPTSPFSDGALAQLVERFHGMEEVNGSTPLSSTISY